MMPFDQLPEAIFDLLAAKSYQQLNTTERQMVDEHLSAQAYDDLHQAVQDFQKVDAQVTPRSEDQAFPPESRTIMTRLLHYPIPAYQVAAGILLVIGCFFALRHTLPQAPAEEGYHYVRTGTAINQDSYPDSLVFEL